MSRVLLPGLAKLATNVDDFMNNLLPTATGEVLNFMNERVRFMVEDSNFFETSFLAQEGLISRERFCGMFGVAGMSECVAELLHLDSSRTYGKDDEANELADQIMVKMIEYVLLQQCVLFLKLKILRKQPVDYLWIKKK